MNSWTKLTEALSELPIFEQLNDEKRQLDTIRPLSEEVEGRVMQKIRLEWNYHSNAIEGNKLTFGETYSFLMYGLTAKGKPLKDHLDIKGHNEAINFLIGVVKDDRDLTETEIRELHKMILVEPYQSPAITFDGQKTSKTILIGEYKKQPNHVKTPTGEIHYYATPEDVPVLMSELVGWYNEARRNEKIHPSVLAAFFHHRFVAIHPFDDGNGRIARILMNLILMQKSYPPAVVKLKERTDYYAALGQADKNEYVPLMEFIAAEVSSSLNIYLKAARGESIEDDGDLDKEIALFKAGLEKPLVQKKEEIVKNIVEHFFFAIVKKANIQLNNFDDLFLKNSKTYSYIYEPFEVEEEDGGHFSDPGGVNKYEINEFHNVVVNAVFDSLVVTYQWQDYNRGKRNIIFNTELSLYPERTEYKIKYNNSILITKLYSEPFTDMEIQGIANKWVRLTLENLKNKIAENK